MHFCLRTYRKLLVVMATATLMLFIVSIPVRLIATSAYSPTPQVILTLGGGPSREEFTALFAQEHEDLDIWVSSGVPTQQAQAIFQQAGIPNSRVHIDRRAIDTVTNFTSLVNDFRDRHIHHVYLITSDFHMRRARAIAFFVFGSRGIITTPVSIPSIQPDETLGHVMRDIGRSVLWIITGRTGASLHPQLQHMALEYNNAHRIR
ncbi:YdcF family protein [Synechococcus moorigangaii CMS01]|nr:YdcF family protein [Synechococcus moorigangaii CMS01]